MAACLVDDSSATWITENGIRFSGMPGWKGELEDDEMWSIVRFLRHLSEKGSQDIPAVYTVSVAHLRAKVDPIQ